MNGRLAAMVTHDTKIFVPAAVLVAILSILVTLRHAGALPGPVAVIAGSTLITLGVMGAAGAKYYLITTALPVVVLAIAIADSVHILKIYMEESRRRPDEPIFDCLVCALYHTITPVTLTTVTTVAGFAGLAVGSAMQPIREFGMFAAVGVIAAWVLSLTLLPAIVLLTKFRPTTAEKRSPKFRPIRYLTAWSYAHPAPAISIAGVLIIIMGWFGAQARFDYSRSDYFPSERSRTDCR